MRTIAQKRPIGFYGLLSKKVVRVAVLLCSLVLVSTAINALIIVLGSKGL
jgi:multisubunit Na+/H+ antiporter MnhC subunit